MANVLAAALVVITAVYAWLTWRIAVESRAAAVASRDAARAAETAAEAANRSAVVAEASLSINFAVELRRHADGDVWFDITPSANVFIYGGTVDCAVMQKKDDQSVARYDGVLRIPEVSEAKKSFPFFVHVDELISLAWHQPTLRRSDYGAFGFINIDYSLSENSQRRVRGVSFETPNGVGTEFISRLNLPVLVNDGETDKEHRGPSED